MYIPKPYTRMNERMDNRFTARHPSTNVKHCHLSLRESTPNVQTIYCNKYLVVTTMRVQETAMKICHAISIEMDSNKLSNHPTELSRPDSHLWNPHPFRHRWIRIHFDARLYCQIAATPTFLSNCHCFFTSFVHDSHSYSHLHTN